MAVAPPITINNLKLRLTDAKMMIKKKTRKKSVAIFSERYIPKEMIPVSKSTKG
jgi:hypothetical protein